MLIVNVATIVLESVAYYYIRYAQYIIICHSLLKSFAADGYVGGFVFYDDQRLQLAAIDYSVAAAAHAVERDANLIGH